MEILKIIFAIISLLLFLFVALGVVACCVAASKADEEMEDWGNEDKGRWK